MQNTRLHRARSRGQVPPTTLVIMVIALIAGRLADRSPRWPIVVGMTLISLSLYLSQISDGSTFSRHPAQFQISGAASA